MPTRRNALKHSAKLRVSRAAIDAWQRGDFLALHRALGLMPWQESPFPQEIEPLGVHQGPPPDYYDERGRADWAQAQALQRQLYELAGEPGQASVSE